MLSDAKSDSETTETALNDMQDDSNPDATVQYDFEVLCVPIYADMVHLAMRLASGDAHRAQDAVQDAYESAMKGWASWTPDGDPAVSARSWLKRIVTNTYIKRYHANRVRSETCERLANEFSIVEHPSPFDQGLSEEVLDALSELDSDRRRAIDLYCLEGRTCAEAAAELGIAAVTVHTRIHRATDSLAQRLRAFAVREYGIGRDYVPSDKKPAVLRRRRAATAR